MPINQNYFLVLDFEAGNTRRDEHAPVSLSSLVIDPRSMEVIPDSEFDRLMAPLNESLLEDATLAYSGITREQLKTAQPQKQVWADFCQYVQQFRCGKDRWDAPILLGHNIIGYDSKLLAALAGRYEGEPEPIRTLDVLHAMARKWNTADANGEFKHVHKIQMIDTMHFFFLMFENLKYPEKLNLEALREFFGFSEEEKAQAHSSIHDCRALAKMFTKMMKWLRGCTGKTKFRGAFSQ